MGVWGPPGGPRWPGVGALEPLGALLGSWRPCWNPLGTSWRPKKVVWEVEGVKEIINEIEIGNRSTLKDYASDLWINTQARAVAAKTVGIKAITFNFETIQGKIYVAGITARPDLLEEMTVALKNIKGVNEIVNYVIIREKL